jgi:hypothetical protein
MSVLIADTLESEVITRLNYLADCDNLHDFEATLRFIINSKYENYREILNFILERDNLRINYTSKYIDLLENYSSSS